MAVAAASSTVIQLRRGCLHRRFIPAFSVCQAREIIRLGSLSGRVDLPAWNSPRCLRPPLHFPPNRRLRAGYDARFPHRPAGIRFLEFLLRVHSRHAPSLSIYLSISLSLSLAFPVHVHLSLPASVQLPPLCSPEEAYTRRYRAVPFRHDGYTKLRPPDRGK